MFHRLFRAVLWVSAGACVLAPGAVRACEMVPFDCLPYDAFHSMHQNADICTPDAFTLMCPAIGFELNNIGYRSTDGLLYGVQLTANGNQGIVRIDSNCNVDPLFCPSGVSGLPTNMRFDAGDVSPGGRWMFINAAGMSPLYIIDLQAADAGTCAVYATATWAAGMGIVHDWTYNPNDGKLYGGDQDHGHLAVLDPWAAVGARTDHLLAPPLPTVPGVLPPGMTTSDYAYGGARYDASGQVVVYRNMGEEYFVDPSLMTQSGPVGCPDTQRRNDAATCWPWFCEDNAFFMQDRGCVLCQCDKSPLIFPTATPICGPLADREINNMGYCRVHQKLYGIELTRTGNLGYVEIDPQTCNVRNLGFGTFDPPASQWTFRNQRLDAGDFSCFESTLYVNRAGLRNVFYRADLSDPDNPHTVKMRMTGALGYVHDWAFNPANGKLYGGDDGIFRNLANGQLAILTEVAPDVWHRTDVTVPGLPSGVAFGGAWFTSAGTLVLHRNQLDFQQVNLYEIDVNASPPAIVMTDAERSSLHNDGASCFPIRDIPGTPGMP